MSDILIIGNAYDDLAQLNTILRKAGFNVRIARSAASGMRAARAITPDLVLLDVLLADMDGFQVCQQLHEVSARTDLPVIFFSALQDATLKAQAFETGGEDFIAKPFQAQEVIVRIRHQLELVRLRQQIQEAARVKERQHIARELHDSVSQTLFILKASAQSLALNTSVLPDQLDEIQTLAQAALAEMRTLLYELRPRQIEAASLQQLLHQLADSYRMRMAAEITVVADDAELPYAVKLAFYRITQEALNNAAKHAHAQHMTVIYTLASGVHLLTIQDDGRGFDTAATRAGMGLQAMRERAEELYLNLVITSAEGQGTQIEATWRALSSFR
jgi:signal transduction histidine kinase